MKIGLLGVEDPSDILSYSGTPFHMAHYLRKADHEVRFLGPYPIKHRFVVGALSRSLKLLRGKHLIWQRHPWITRQYASIVAEYARQHPDLDLLLGTSAFYLAGAKVDLPVAFWGDSTVAGLISMYDGYLHVTQRTIDQAHEVEQQALTSADLAIFSNHWGARVALDSYTLDAEKVHIITYGANLMTIPSEAEIAQSLANRRFDRLDILLIGVRWHRKGVDIAIEILNELRRRGHDAHLTVVGCYPPADYAPSEHVTVTGVISKRTPDGAERLKTLFHHSRVFLLPTRADCAAVVLAEASAFALPLVTSNVGGNASLVSEGVNGFAVPIDAPISAWADTIEKIPAEQNAYEEFAWAAYRYFKSDLSWEVAIARFTALVQSKLLVTHADR